MKRIHILTSWVTYERGAELPDPQGCCGEQVTEGKHWGQTRHGADRWGSCFVVSGRVLLMDPSFSPCLELLLVAWTGHQGRCGFLGEEVFEEMAPPLAWAFCGTRA